MHSVGLTDLSQCNYINVGIGAQTSIVQSLTYFEHLSEPMAEFLHILAEQYDYPQLSDEILK
jgi:condensin complex subunit 1